MFACSKIFERIHFPKELYETHLLEWLIPTSKQESLTSYVDRFAALITHPNPIIVGVSFGGIIAQELGIRFKHSKIIIISSIKSSNELPPIFHFLKKSKLYQWYPVFLISSLEKLLLRMGTKQLKRKILSYQYYLPVRDKVYTTWAIHHFLHWTPNSSLKITHLHGTKDAMLPIKHIKKKVTIPEGTHAMILAKAHTITTEILKAIT